MTRKFAFYLAVAALLATPAQGQEPQASTLTVNGRSLGSVALLGFTGTDWALKVSPVLKALGAKVLSSNERVEATWYDGRQLILIAGQPTCEYCGQTFELSTPCGGLEHDLVMAAGELCQVLGAEIRTTPRGEVIITKMRTASPNGTVAVAAPGMSSSAPSSSVAPPYSPSDITATAAVPLAVSGSSAATAGTLADSYIAASPLELQGGLSAGSAASYESPASSAYPTGIQAQSALNVPQANPMASSGANGRMTMDQFGIPVGMAGSMGAFQGGGAGGYKMGLPSTSSSGYGNASGGSTPPVSNFPYTGGVPSMAGMAGTMSMSGSAGMSGMSGMSGTTGMSGASGTSGMSGMPVGSSNTASMYGGMPNMSGMAGMAGKSGLSSMQAPSLGGMGSAVSTPTPGAYTPGGMAGIMGMNIGANATNPLDNVGQKEEGVRIIPANRQPADLAVPTETDQRQAMSEPARFEVSQLEVKRLMGFQLTAYQVTIRVKNTGGCAPDRPLRVVLSAKGTRAKNFDQLAAYNIDPLQPGDEVEIVMKADGRQYACLTEIKINFQVSVLESKVTGPPKSARLTKEQRLEWAKNPAMAQDTERSYQEVCSKEHTTSF